jgi:RNA polymerase sigma-B factor
MVRPRVSQHARTVLLDRLTIGPEVKMPGPTTVARRRSRDDQLLFERHRRMGDAASLEELVERWLPLAQHLARRYPAGGEDDDLMQVASLGLLKAIDRYDPAQGVAFSSYAVPTILGELKRYFRDHGWAVRVPRELQERSIEVNAVSTRLSASLGRSPTAAEIAGVLGTSTEHVLEALATASAHYPDRLDPPADADDPDHDLHHAFVHEPGFARAEDTATLDPLLDRLPPDEREAVRLRFEDDLTQTEIGAQLGLSQMQISRILRRALTSLRELAGEG